MKLYVCHSCGFDYERELYGPLRNSMSDNHDIFFPHEGENSKVNTTRIIKDSDLLIAEISFPSTGLGIELGRAEVFGKRVVCIFKKNSEYSKAINFVSEDFIEYEDSEDMVKKLKNFISRLD